MSIITSTHTRCVAKFFPFQGDTGMSSKELTEDDAIVECSIGKDLAMPSSSFQLTLKQTKDFTKILKPGDWVAIYLGSVEELDTNSHDGLKEIGIIDRVALSEVTLESGVIVRNYIVYGSGFGKLFERNMIYFSPYVLSQINKFISRQARYKKTGTPKDFVEFYLDVFAGNALKQDVGENLFQMLVPPALYTFTKGKTREKGSDVAYIDIIEQNFDEDTADGYSPFRDIITSNSGSLWNTMMQASNESINELYTDIRGGKPTLIFRKLPLTESIKQQRINETKNNARYQVGNHLIINSNLGLADHELKNFIYILPSDEIQGGLASIYESLYPTDKPNLDRDSIKRYGLRVAQFFSEYSFNKSGHGMDISILEKWKKELGEYWSKKWLMEAGTFDIIGKSDFEIGQYYHFTDRGKIYRVRGIQYKWIWGQTIITSLSVTHGVDSSGNITEQLTPSIPTLSSNINSSNFPRVSKSLKGKKCR